MSFFLSADNLYHFNCKSNDTERHHDNGNMKEKLMMMIVDWLLYVVDQLDMWNIFSNWIHRIISDGYCTYNNNNNHNHPYQHH